MDTAQDTPSHNYQSKQVRIFFLFLFLFAVSTKRSVSSWNDASRMATIQALVEQGTLVIDDTMFVDLTSDIYLYQDHTYSSKPPALAVMGALVYVPLHLAGITFEEGSIAPLFPDHAPHNRLDLGVGISLFLEDAR